MQPLVHNVVQIWHGTKAQTNVLHVLKVLTLTITNVLTVQNNVLHVLQKEPALPVQAQVTLKMVRVCHVMQSVLAVIQILGVVLVKRLVGKKLILLLLQNLVKLANKSGGLVNNAHL